MAGVVGNDDFDGASLWKGFSKVFAKAERGTADVAGVDDGGAGGWVFGWCGCGVGA